MATPKNTTTKKASASTEMVLGQAAQQIAKAVSELNAATSTVNQLVTQAEELTLQVANKESQIADLEVQYTEKARQAEVEFDLNVKANAERVVTEWLRTNGKVSISSTELNSLQKELTDTKAGIEAEVKKQVASASASMKVHYENEIRTIQLENKAIAAENAAKLNALVQNEKNLQEQVTKLYLQLDAERAAGIERAKAGSVGTINLTSPSK